MKLPFELASPSGLWLLAGLVPLVALYVLKIRRERRVVSSTWLWAAAERDRLARSPFRRLRPETSLLLEALALVLFTLALARPAWKSRELTGEHVAIVVDVSASMRAARTDGRARVEVAREAALGALAATAPGAEAMLVAAAQSPEVVVASTLDRISLRSALQRLDARDVEGDLPAAIDLAATKLRALRGTKRIVVVTDGALASGALGEPEGVALDVLTVGDRVDNAGIVRFDVRAGRDPATRADEVQAFSIVANFGARPRELWVTLREQGASDVLASRRVLVGPNERAPVLLAFKPTPADAGRGLVVEISPHDALATDDAAYARVPLGAALPVVLAGDRVSPWLARAMASDRDLDVRSGKIADVVAAGVSPDALVVWDGACPSAQVGGDWLVVAPPTGTCLGADVGGEVERPPITSWAASDPRLRFLTLDGVHVTRARPFATDADARALIRTTAGALALDASTPTRGVTMLAFDVGDTDWPLQASYVLFVRNVVEQARGRRARGLATAVRTGAPLSLGVPPDVESVTLVSPDHEASNLRARGGVVVVADPARAGVYHLSWAGATPGSTLVAANLVSERESDLAPRELRVEHGNVTDAGAIASPLARVESGWLFALAALCAVLVDVGVTTRKPRRRDGARPAAPPRSAR